MLRGSRAERCACCSRRCGPRRLHSQHSSPRRTGSSAPARSSASRLPGGRERSRASRVHAGGTARWKRPAPRNTAVGAGAEPAVARRGGPAPCGEVGLCSRACLFCAPSRFPVGAGCRGVLLLHYWEVAVCAELLPGRRCDDTLCCCAAAAIYAAVATAAAAAALRPSAVACVRLCIRFSLSAPVTGECPYVSFLLIDEFIRDYVQFVVSPRS